MIPQTDPPGPTPPAAAPIARLLLALLAPLLCAAAAAAPAAAGGPADADWPSFRGSQARGVAEGFPTATRWDVPEGRGVLWRTPIPGLGHASPVVWGDRVYVLTAVGAGEAELKVGLYGDIGPVADEGEQSWRLFALDAGSGKVVWERELHRGVPRSKRHPKSSHANPTPATDGRRLAVMLASEGLVVLDLDGEVLWRKDLGPLDSGYFRVPGAQWGFASSPVLHDGKVIVQADVQEGSFLAAFDAATGEEVWRTARGDVPTWSTPTVEAGGERPQVLVNGYRHAGGYDLATGRELWRLSGRGDIPVPTPVVAHGLVFLTHAHGGAATYAVRLDARGDVTPAEGAETSAGVVWSEPRNAAYMQTPIVYGDELYVSRDNGVLSCHDARTGELHYRERIDPKSSGGFTASPVAADGKLYFTSEEGQVHVLRAGRRFEVLAVNPLGELAMATPAISRGVLFFRTRGHVVAVAAPEPPPAREP